MTDTPKPWHELTPREKDTRVAEALGWELDWEFADLDYFGAPTVPHLRDQYDEWGLLPAFTESLDDARIVEDEVEKRGLFYPYIEALYPAYNSFEGILVKDLFALMRTTAEQRCRAAVEVLTK